MNAPARQFTPDELDLLREFDRRERALATLPAFREYIAASGHADFQYPHAPHHRVLADALEKLASGEIQRLMVMMPPGSAKSTVGSVQFLSWYAALNPSDQILAVSSTQALAENFARRRRNVCHTQEWQNLAGVTINPDQQSVGNFGYGNNGSQMAAGVGTSVIGRRAQIIVTDDSTSSFEEISSPARREAMWQWYMAELRSRLTPGGKELMIGTRWSVDDLFGRILESEEADTWTVIRMPMLADAANDPMGREIGDPLWPEWFTSQQINENLRDPLRWSCMYQQTPVDEQGSWLMPEDLPIVDKAPPGLRIISAADLATSDSASADYSVVITAGMDHERNLYILDVWRDRVSPNAIVDRLMAIYKQHRPGEILIDNDLGSKMFKPLAHEILRRHGTPLPMREMPTGGKNKVDRAQSFQGFARMGAVKLVRGHWNAELIREVSHFPREGSGYFDDQVDCLSLLGRRLPAMGSGAGTSETKAPPPPIVGAFQQTDEGTFTTETLSDLWDSRPKRQGIIRL